MIVIASRLTLMIQIPSNRWTQLSKRRLQAHPSTLTAKNTLIAASLPEWLMQFPPVRQRFAQLGIFADTKHKEPNHVLINEYNPGEGIMPHEDGAAYSPVVATISLGTPIVLDIYSKRSEKQDGTDGDESPNLVASHRIFQEPGSLLVTTGEAYVNLLHGISPTTKDENLNVDTVANWELLGDKEALVQKGGVSERGLRISLTYRDVLKVSKVGLGILGKR